MKNKKPTTYDVARLAGVSQSTASMILSNKKNVSFSDETILQVKKIAEELGYKPKTRKNFDISSLIIAIISPTSSNPYYSSLNQSIEYELSKLGYIALSCTTYRDAELEKQYLETILNSSISGIIYTAMPYQRELVESISINMPIVIISDKDESTEVDTIELSSRESAHLIADHLISLSHKKVAFVTTDLTKMNIPRIRRLEGIREKFAEIGGEVIVFENKKQSRKDAFDVKFESRVGYEATKQLIKIPDITALIGVNDMLSYGIVNALVDEGYKVPDDYSVCGFDDIFPSAFNQISLTTIDHNLYNKGKDSVDILHKKITIPSYNSNRSIYRIEYKPSLVIRNSTGPAHMT